MDKYLDDLFGIDHFLGKMGLEEVLYLRFANTMLEPVWNRDYLGAAVQVTMAEAFGVEDRGHFYDPAALAPSSSTTWQVIAATAMSRPGSDPGCSATPIRLFQAMLDADPKRYCGASTRATRDPGGRARFDHRDLRRAEARDRDRRWSGVPFFVRTASDCR